MKNTVRNITLAASKVDARTIRFILLVVSLTAFVLGAGAPSGDGGIGMR